MPKILIVDDTPDNILLLQTILRVYGYAVETATEGYSALQKVQQNPPDAILMDLAMPGLNGWETIRTLKQDVRYNTIPVIALSAQVMESDRQRAIAVGCDSYLKKPFDIPTLIATLEHLLSVRLAA